MNDNVDTENLADVFESRYGLVLEAAVRFAPHSDLAHDIAQETFLIFVEGVQQKKWGKIRNIDTFLYGIAKHVARRNWEKELRNTTEALRLIGERIASYRGQEPDGASDPGVDRITALTACLDKLTPRGRHLLEEHYRRNRTIEEIGKTNDIQSNTLRKMFTRLRTRLRECIDTTLRERKET